MQFESKGLAQPHEVTLVPLYRIVNQRYNVYWNLLTPAEWTARKTEMAAADARRRTFEQRTIDRVDIDAAQSEKDHRLESDKATDAFFEGKRVREARGGWFAYQLSAVQLDLNCFGFPAARSRNSRARQSSDDSPGSLQPPSRISAEDPPVPHGEKSDLVVIGHDGCCFAIFAATAKSAGSDSPRGRRDCLR